MAQAGATLQNYNNELVSCIEELREKREDLNKSIAGDEEEKGALPPAAAACRTPVCTLSLSSRHASLSQNTERPADPDGAACADQRRPCAQDLLAQRV